MHACMMPSKEISENLPQWILELRKIQQDILLSQTLASQSGIKRSGENDRKD